MKGNTAEKLGGEPLNPYAAPTDAGPPVAPSEASALATPWERLGAQMLDGLLMVAAFAPGAIMGAILNTQLDQGASAEERVGLLVGGLGALGVLVLCLYQWGLVAASGQSLGKRWMRVRIVVGVNEPPGVWRGVILRSFALGLLRVIPMIGSVIGLIDSLMVFSDGHLTLHDRIAGTRVLKD